MISQSTETYLGYGLLSDPLFVRNLLGRELKPSETRVQAKGFQLKTVGCHDLPEALREITETTFKAYGLRTSDPNGKPVKLLKLELSVVEREVVRALHKALNLGDDLYLSQTVRLEDGTEATVDLLKNPDLGTPVENGLTYNSFIEIGQISHANTVAEELCEEFIKSAAEGSASPNPEKE